MIKFVWAAFSLKGKPARIKNKKSSSVSGRVPGGQHLLGLTLQKRCCWCCFWVPSGWKSPSAAELRAGCQRTWVAADWSRAGGARWLDRRRTRPHGYRTDCEIATSTGPSGEVIMLRFRLWFLKSLCFYVVNAFFSCLHRSVHLLILQVPWNGSVHLWSQLLIDGPQTRLKTRSRKEAHVTKVLQNNKAFLLIRIFVFVKKILCSPGSLGPRRSSWWAGSHSTPPDTSGTSGNGPEVGRWHRISPQSPHHLKAEPSRLCQTDQIKHFPKARPSVESPPNGGMTWSRSFMLVRFQICFMMARSSSLAFSKLPVQNQPMKSQ